MINVDLSGLLPAVQTELDSTLRRVSVAIENSAKVVVAEWSDAVMKSPGLSPGEREAYINSIVIKMTGPYSAEVVAEYGYADQIENGRPPRDLKKCLQTSQRTRISKSGPHKGQKYLVIPIRINTPGNDAHAQSMPQEVYAKAKYLSPSSVTGMGTRVSATGATVPQAKYLWAGRLPVGSFGPNPKGKVDRLAGMVRMNTSAGKSKSSAYLVFRAMAESSSGWVIRARPGLKIAATVEKQLEPVILEIVRNAINAHG